MKNVNWLQAESDALKRAFKHVTGFELQEIVAQGDDEKSFNITGFYQSIVDGNIIIEAAISKVNSYTPITMTFMEQENYSMLDQVISFEHRKYRITISTTVVP